MLPNVVNDQLKRQPFLPFRIYLSDGASYDVRHPDMAWVGATEVLVGVPGETRPAFFERFHILNLFQVTRLEPLEQLAPAKKKRAG